MTGLYTFNTVVNGRNRKSASWSPDRKDFQATWRMKNNKKKECPKRNSMVRDFIKLEQFVVLKLGFINSVIQVHLYFNAELITERRC